MDRSPYFFHHFRSHVVILLSLQAVPITGDKNNNPWVFTLPAPPLPGLYYRNKHRLPLLPAIFVPKLSPILPFFLFHISHHHHKSNIFPKVIEARNEISYRRRQYESGWGVSLSCDVLRHTDILQSRFYRDLSGKYLLFAMLFFLSPRKGGSLENEDNILCKMCRWPARDRRGSPSFGMTPVLPPPPSVFLSLYVFFTVYPSFLSLSSLFLLFLPLLVPFRLFIFPSELLLKQIQLYGLVNLLR